MPSGRSVGAYVSYVLGYARLCDRDGWSFLVWVDGDGLGHATRKCTRSRHDIGLQFMVACPLRQMYGLDFVDIGPGIPTCLWCVLRFFEP